MLQAMDVEDHIILRAALGMRRCVQEAAEWVEEVAAVLAAFCRSSKCWALRLRPLLTLCRQHYDALSASWVLLLLMRGPGDYGLYLACITHLSRRRAFSLRDRMFDWR